MRLHWCVLKFTNFLAAMSDTKMMDLLLSRVVQSRSSVRLSETVTLSSWILDS